MVKGRTAKNWLNLMLLIGGMASGAMGLVVLVGSYTHDVHLLQALQAVGALAIQRRPRIYSLRRRAAFRCLRSATARDYLWNGSGCRPFCPVLWL